MSTLLPAWRCAILPPDDPIGTSLSLTDAEGNTTTFAYDRLNRLITTINSLSLTDANTHTTSFSYDHLNRTPGTYTLWLRGYPSNAAGDSAYLGLGG